MSCVIDFFHNTNCLYNIDRNTVSLLTFDNKIKDLGRDKSIWTNTNPSNITLSSDQTKFSKNSLAFNINSTTPGYFSLTAQDEKFKTLFSNPFTIDWWEYRLSSYPHFAMSWPNYAGYTSIELVSSSSNWDSPEILILKNNQNDNLVLCGDGVIDSVIDIVSPIKYDTWEHIAICWDNNIWYVFENGILKNSLVNSAKNLNTLDTIHIGLNYLRSDRMNEQKSYLFHGYMDMIRISSICRWTSDFDLNILYS